MTPADIAKDPRVLNIIETALGEDLAGGPDVTTEALVAADRVIQAVILTRESITVAGTTVAQRVFEPPGRLSRRRGEGESRAQPGRDFSLAWTLL